MKMEEKEKMEMEIEKLKKQIKRLPLKILKRIAWEAWNPALAAAAVRAAEDRAKTGAVFIDRDSASFWAAVLYLKFKRRIFAFPAFTTTKICDYMKSYSSDDIIETYKRDYAELQEKKDLFKYLKSF